MGFYERLKRTARAMRLAWSSRPADTNTKSCRGNHNEALGDSSTTLFSEKDPQNFKESKCDDSTIVDPAPPAYAHESSIALHHAAYTGNVSLTSVHLSTPGIDVNTTDKHGYTPLLYAAQKGRTGVVKRLLKNPEINVNPCDTFGISALSWAARRGHLEIVELLLKTPGVLANQKCDKGRTPLLRAAMKGHVAVVEALLKVPGVEIDVKDSTGSTPLLLASQCGHEEVVALLLRVAAAGTTEDKARLAGRGHKCCYYRG